MNRARIARIRVGINPTQEDIVLVLNPNEKDFTAAAAEARARDSFTEQNRRALTHSCCLNAGARTTENSFSAIMLLLSKYSGPSDVILVLADFILRAYKLYKVWQ